MKHKAAMCVLSAGLLMAACAQSEKDTLQTQTAQTSQSEPVKLLEVYQEADDQQFLSHMSADSIVSISYYKDESVDYQSGDPELIAQTLDALEQMESAGEYEGDMQATDSMMYVQLINKDGHSFRITFDSGRLQANGKEYEVSGMSALSDIFNECEERMDQEAGEGDE